MELRHVCAALKETSDFSSRTYEWERKCIVSNGEVGQFESAENCRKQMIVQSDDGLTGRHAWKLIGPQVEIMPRNNCLGKPD